MKGDESVGWKGIGRKRKHVEGDRKEWMWKGIGRKGKNVEGGKKE